MIDKERVLILFGADSNLEWGRSYQVGKAVNVLGHDVVYVDLPLPIGKKSQKIHNNNDFKIYNPKNALPCAKLPFLRNINYYCISRQIFNYLESISFSPTIIWAYAPYEPRIAIELKSKFGSKILLHDLADERISLAETQHGKNAARITKEYEEELAKQCDFLVVITEVLKEAKKHLHNKILVMPNGVDTDFFSPSRIYPVPEIYKLFPGKKVLYIGSVESWVDIESVKYAACQSPNIVFFLVGPVRTDISLLHAVSNIHVVERRPYSEMPAWIQHADVCMLPFKDNEVTRNSDPLKVLQYLAMGKPMVSLYYEGVNDYNGNVIIARDYKEFTASLRSLCNRPPADSSAVLAMIEEKYSWNTLVANCLKNTPDILHDH